MAKQDPDDYFNLGRPDRQDDFALGESQNEHESSPRAPRSLIILPLVIGFIILFGVLVTVFVMRVWQPTPIDLAQQDIKIIEPAGGAISDTSSSKPANPSSPAIVPVKPANDSAPATAIPTPVPSVEPALRPVNVVLKELTPAIGMVVVRTAKGLSSGSGFIIQNDGLFVTNYHVIEGAQEIAIKLNDSDQINSAYIDRVDQQKDLALLRLEQRGPYPVLKLEDGPQPELGEEVIVLGYPLGTQLGLDLTVSTGIVSSLRSYPEISLIQTNAAINHGNSGGPMVYRRTNRVVGVVTAKARDSESIGFAINVKELKRMLAER